MEKIIPTEKDIKYTFSLDITITPENIMLGALRANHNNVAADMNITKSLQVGEDKRTAAIRRANTLLKLADNFIASAVTQDPLSGPTGGF